jgi:hypothetical protein
MINIYKSMSETAIILTDLGKPGDDLNKCKKYHKGGKLHFHRTIRAYIAMLQNTVAKLELLADFVPEDADNVDLCGNDDTIELTADGETIDMLEQNNIVEKVQYSDSESDSVVSEPDQSDDSSSESDSE